MGVSKFVAALAGIVLSLSAQASVIGSVMTGVVTSPTVDTLGVFGVIGADLNGLAVKQTISWDRATVNDYPGLGPGSSGNQGTTLAHVSTTINGVTVTFDETVYVNALIYAGVSGGYGPYDEVQTLAQGLVNGGAGFIIIHQTASSSKAFTGTTLDVGDYLFQCASADMKIDGFFSYQDISLAKTTSLGFSGRLATIEWNGDLGADVPEPASLALLGLGLAGLGAARRRKPGA